MGSSSLEEEKIIIDVRNLSRLEKLKKETTDTTIIYNIQLSILYIYKKYF